MSQYWKNPNDFNDIECPIYSYDKNIREHLIENSKLLKDLQRNCHLSNEHKAFEWLDKCV